MLPSGLFPIGLLIRLNGNVPTLYLWRVVDYSSISHEVWGMRIEPRWLTPWNFHCSTGLSERLQWRRRF
jgi:hypothetical protein